MKTCEKCSKEFPTWTVVDDKKVNLQRRKYCLECSPFGEHNTVRIENVRPKFSCPCGETNPKKFNPKKSRQCTKCKSSYDLRKGQEKKDKARKHLGGKCVACGFDKWLVSLDIHHPDPSKKDPNFASMRSWSWKRILRELEQAKCILLCRNCHGAYHAGVDVFRRVA